MSPRVPPFVVVVNPRAAAGRARERIPALEQAFRECGAIFRTVLTTAPGDATRLVREALRGGASGVAVVGGDGTMNEAVNGFFDERGQRIVPDAWLGPLPCGTGGDFRKTLKLSNEIPVMVTHMMWAKPRPIDVGWLEFRDNDGAPVSRAFINIASFGLGGLVDRLVNQGPKWIGGRAAFLIGAVRAAASFDSRRVRISLDGGEPEELDVINVAVANGQFFGGGMHIAPKAAVDDGILDVVCLEGRSFVEQTTLLPDLYRGTILERPGVRHYRAKRVVAEAADWSGPVLLDVDGEAPGSLPATFQILPGAVRLRG